MKLFFLAILLSAFSTSAASAQASNYGKKLNLARSQQGQPVMSFVYYPDVTSFYFIDLSFPTTEVVHLQKRIDPVYLSFVNSESGEVLIPWTEMPHKPQEIATAETSLELLHIQHQGVKEVVRSFNKVFMLLSFKKPLAEASADFYISLSEICSSNQELFKDVDRKTLCQ